MGRHTTEQMEIFDFMEKSPGQRACESGQASKTLLQGLFGRLKNPAVRCRNCLCNFCANNAEELYHKVKPEEMRECCLDCDGCREYTGDCAHRSRAKEDCEKFVVSDYGAGMVRGKFRIVEEKNDA